MCECPYCDATTIDPVCGSDQNSYPSECQMKRSSCIRGKLISVVRNGPCGKEIELLCLTNNDRYLFYNSVLLTLLHTCCQEVANNYFMARTNDSLFANR